MTAPSGTPRRPDPGSAPKPARQRKAPEAPRRKPAQTYRQGFWRRVANTPFRDLARGRISGRLDVRHLLVTSALAPRLRSLVADVVRRARLWKMERADVAVELIAHFRDGLETGQDTEALESAFGSTRRTARLIRRAKRRSRPLMWRAWVRSARVAGIVLAVFVVIYVAATIRLFVGKPVIAHDYLAELNAMAGAVPADERAWPRYREALQQLGLPATSPQPYNFHSRPGDGDWQEVSDFLETHVEALQTAREAASRPGLGYLAAYTLDEADLVLWPEQAGLDGSGAEVGLVAVLLPHLAELRKLAKVLSADARRAAASSDGADATANLEAILGIAEHMRETPFLINELLSLSTITLALRTLGEILAEQPGVFTDRQLRILPHRLAALQGGGRLQVRLDAEAMFFRDMMQRMYTDDGDGDGHLTARGLESLDYVRGVWTAPQVRFGPLMPAAGLILASRRAMTEQFERLLGLTEAELSKPLWRQDWSVVDRELNRLERSWFLSRRYLPVVLLMPVIGRPGRNAELVTQERDALLAAIALELYRRRTGGWPQALAELVPEFLPGVPPDRFDGAQLRYRFVDGRPVLYSIGADGVDDGGRPPRDRTGAYEPVLTRLVDDDGSPAASGDWVLWPSGDLGWLDRPPARPLATSSQ